MPKIKLTVKQVIKDFGGGTIWQEENNGKSILCKVCIARFSMEKTFLIKQHATTAKHKQNVEQADAKPKQVKI